MDQIDYFYSILNNYNIGKISSITSQESGTKNKSCEIWIEGRKKYFLREKDSSTTVLKDLEYDHSLMEYFSSNEIVTPSPVSNLNGETITEFSGNYYELTKYIDGKPFIRDSEEHLMIAGRDLGRFHLIGTGFQRDYSKPFGRIDPPGPARDVFNDLFTNDNSKSEFPELEYILYELDLIENDLTDEIYRSLPQVLIHGDFHPGNVKYIDGSLAFFDLDWVSIQPRLQDLAYGILFFASDRRENIDPSDIYSLTASCTLSIKKSLEFISAYNSIIQLESKEFHYLPYFIKIAWICCRADGSKKVPTNDRKTYIKKDILIPIESVDELTDELRKNFNIY